MLQVACGIDVHKKQLTSTITSDASKETRGFAATSEGLEELKDWLKDHKCRDVALESTGVLWAPIYFALGESFHLVLANAYQVKSIPGRKTGQSNSEWLAQLLRCGLIKPSYIPEKPLRTLRELTRARVKLLNARTGIRYIKSLTEPI